MPGKKEKFSMEKFLDGQKKIAEHKIFEEASESAIRNVIMRNRKREYIKEYYLSDLIMNGDKVILKWTRNYPSMSEQELDKFFNPEKE